MEFQCKRHFIGRLMTDMNRKIIIHNWQLLWHMHLTTSIAEWVLLMGCKLD